MGYLLFLEKMSTKNNCKSQEKDAASGSSDQMCDKEVYEKVKLLLKEHEDLVKAQEAIRTLGSNLETEKMKIEESVDKVRTSWNIK